MEFSAAGKNKKTIKNLVCAWPWVELLHYAPATMTINLNHMNAFFVSREILSRANPEKARVLRSYFKTGKGQYAEGDKMLGVSMPQLRDIVKSRPEFALDEIQTLLDSEYHEVRMSGFLFLVRQFKKSKDEAERKSIFDFYLKNIRRANNWDLVDASCRDIVGSYLLVREELREVLHRLAESQNLWEQRTAIVSTWVFIKHGQFEDTLTLARRFFSHKHDLIHKATGWMLRELGKKDRRVLRDFLGKHSCDMPRTALRYAIEHFAPSERSYFMRLDRGE
ncbi:MAG: DNA alkylation repair protein [Puniceicoccales bacterium]|nr:DNA alkylation repair protein [Puniceicoccales bacterium]